MRRILLLIICMVFVSSCFVDFYMGKRPENYPNTRWVSENPDMYFEIGENINAERPNAAVIGAFVYSQIVIDGEIIELRIAFGTGSDFFAYNPAGFDTVTGYALKGHLTNDYFLFGGLCKFSPNRLVVTIDRNDKGFLDESITEIIFIREDIDA